MSRRLKRSRLTFFVGINTGYASGGVPDHRFKQFYEERSSPELHCAIVGNVVVPGGHPTNDRTLSIAHASVWRPVVKAIVSRGTLPGIQFATTWEGYQGPRTFRPRRFSDAIAESRMIVRKFSSAALSQILMSLHEAGNIAIDAGFQHLQLHAAHGYLFNLLIDERIYDGADDVLGMLGDWFAKIRTSVPETSIRISLRSGDAQFDADADRFQDKLVRTIPVDYVDVSSGFYNVDKRLIYPGRPDIIVTRRRETVALASRHPSFQFIYSGRALLQSVLDLPDNIHIGICRDLIANPTYLTNRDFGCVNSGKCHYYSRGTEHVTCSQWTKA